jgi:hypothetical protein
VRLLDRIRRFWSSQPEFDHPLTEQERDRQPPATAYEERARLEQEFVGDDFDPDESRAPGSD